MDLVSQLKTSLIERYAIDREIGRGGMATVYLARDVRHDRRVALKVLNPELGALLGVDRFVAEIKVTANLQHPNLVPLFDSGEAAGQLFYVMPFIEGESLRSRLARERQLPVDDAVRIAVGIAGALDYAHRHGVIHRDLKPENILLHEGQPLVADFGIALAVTNAAGTRITQSGISLGTPQYMSPEQAAGEQTIDGRTDIYALGAVLYEMLVGNPPHTGATAQAVVAKVIAETPNSVRTTRPSVPVHVDAAIGRALEKAPADRFTTAQEMAEVLEGKRALPQTTVPVGPRSLKLGLKDAIYGTLLLAAAGVFAATRIDRPADPPAMLRVPIALPGDSRFNDAFVGTDVALSPQGDRVAYTILAAGTGSQLLARALDQLEARPLYEGPSVRGPVFSPDGKWVAFADASEIKKVSVDGGPAIPLATIPDVTFGLSWGSAGLLAVGSGASGLYVVPEGGGSIRAIPKVEGQVSDRWPLILPNGRDVVFMTKAGTSPSGHLHVRALSGGDQTDLGITGGTPLGFLQGQLVYSTPSGALMAVPFDVGRRVVTGSPAPVEQNVVTDPQGGAKAGLSASGMLLFRRGESQSQPVLTRGGNDSVSTLLPEARAFFHPRFSPDGRRVAFGVTGTRTSDIWVFDRNQKTLTVVTSGGDNARPEWTPDGRRLVFISNRSGESAIWWQPADASAPAELLYKPVEGDPLEAMISPDGKWLLYRTGPAGKPPRAVMAIGMDRREGGKSVRVLADSSFIQMPRLSPNGHWLAYQSNVSGHNEVYVRSFPDSSGRVQVSTETGSEPLWSRSGRTLFYRGLHGIEAVSVGTGTSFTMLGRTLVLKGSEFLTSPTHPNYDVAPGDSGFLMLRRAGEQVQTVLVQNWVRALSARTPAPR
jgi:serine/threonine-protein kinase